MVIEPRIGHDTARRTFQGTGRLDAGIGRKAVANRTDMTERLARLGSRTIHRARCRVGGHPLLEP
jgi:hypothetical protein